MAKQQAIKSTSNYTPVQYCPICQTKHDKVYNEKITKIEADFDKSEKTEQDKKKYKAVMEKTKCGHTVLTLRRECTGGKSVKNGTNILVCQALVEQTDKTKQHFSAPHFEKLL